MRTPLMHIIVFGAMAVLGAGAAALAVPYDMPGLGDNSSTAPAGWSPGGPAGGEPACDGQGCDGGLSARLFDSCNGPRWTFTGEVVALQRTGNYSQPLTVSLDNPTVISASDLDIPLAAGFHTSAVCHGAPRPMTIE